MLPISLEKRTALVSGGSRGIGRAIALTLARAGAAVGVGYANDSRGAREVVDSILRQGGRAVSLEANLSHWSAAEQMVRQCAEQLGPPDILVVSHGIWKRAPIDRITEPEWNEMADVNLKGVIALCRYAVERMRPLRRGSIVLISSTAGQRGEAEHSHYAATKGAIISLTKSLCPELAPLNIRVNCVAPGWVETDMVHDTLADPGQRRQIERAIPLGRVGRPEEIAGAVLFLASDLSTFVSGEILNVNGGAVLVG
ncbi:MAG TPA: 3-oxoacyl-ACP reductase family protein [Myxococcaceae bacterium]|nr:3-oxoacyl-ACP reductase family protein [Myxococcaceae bacterium]